MRGLAGMRAPRCARSSDVSRSFEPDSGLASTECRLRHTVLRETWEEAFERLLPNLVLGLCGRVLAGCG